MALTVEVEELVEAVDVAAGVPAAVLLELLAAPDAGVLVPDVLELELELGTELLVAVPELEPLALVATADEVAVEVESLPLAPQPAKIAMMAADTIHRLNVVAHETPVMDRLTSDAEPLRSQGRVCDSRV
jgi:hypothetical protein